MDGCNDKQVFRFMVDVHRNDQAGIGGAGVFRVRVALISVEPQGLTGFVPVDCCRLDDIPDLLRGALAAGRDPKERLQ